jgi:hypothetical protein
LCSLAWALRWLFLRQRKRPTAYREDGKVLNGKYTKEYFELAYPLPSGWSEDHERALSLILGLLLLAALESGGGDAVSC